MDLSKGNSIFKTCFILLRLIWIGITEFLPRIWLCPLHVFALHRPILFCLFFSPFFSLNQFIYFNWRLITLHSCGSFCHTLTRISHWCTCVPHSEPPTSLPIPSLWVVPVHQLWMPCFMHRTRTHRSILLQRLKGLKGQLGILYREREFFIKRPHIWWRNFT